MNQKERIKRIYKARISKNKNLPKYQQLEHVISTTTIKDKQPYKNTTKKIVKQVIGTCQECDSKTYVVDYHRGEKVCPKCGYVYNNNVFEKPRYPKYRESNKYFKTKSFTETDKKQLHYKNRHVLTEADEWRKRQQEREIDIISTNLELNKWQKQRINEIITKVGLKKLHNKADMTTITYGVARYIMKRTTKNIVLLRYDRPPFKDNLTPNQYHIIEKNIKKHYYHLKEEDDNNVNPRKNTKTEK